MRSAKNHMLYATNKNAVKMRGVYGQYGLTRFSLRTRCRHCREFGVACILHEMRPIGPPRHLALVGFVVCTKTDSLSAGPGEMTFASEEDKDEHGECEHRTGFRSVGNRVGSCVADTRFPIPTRAITIP